jgi:propionyl-CoA carboxylase alpha chain
MIRAIEEYEVGGVETTLGFGKFVMEHEAFRTADFDTNFVSKYFTPDALVQPNEDREEVAVLLAAYLMSGKKESTKTSASNGVSAKSKWKINRKA